MTYESSHVVKILHRGKNESHKHVNCFNESHKYDEYHSTSINLGSFFSHPYVLSQTLGENPEISLEFRDASRDALISIILNFSSELHLRNYVSYALEMCI